jgi:digeranylgeranylglycerophospholipid reductase
LCLSACPVAALTFDGADRLPEHGSSLDLSPRYDVVVVGAGPAGSVAARIAARSGLSVLLIEKRQEVGSPVRCAEGIGHAALVPFLAPSSRWIASTVDKAVITTIGPSGSETVRAEGGCGYILERRVFDRVLAQEAAKSGAHLAVKCAATGLLMESGVVRGVRVRGLGGETDVEARVTIAADGVESQVGRWAGLNTTLPLRDTMTCAQYLLAGIDIDPTCCYYVIGEEVAPGGYGWVFPKGARCANVGLGVQADLSGTVSPMEYLQRFIEDRPHLAAGSPVTLVVGGVPVALPPASIVTGGLLLVGDAARQVDPLTGGGIGTGMAAAGIAAEVAAAAIAENDVSATRLSEYEDRWKAGPGSSLARSYRWRQRFPPETRAGSQFRRVFAAAVAG